MENKIEEKSEYFCTLAQSQLFHHKMQPVEMGKSRPRSISISANQNREVGSSQYSLNTVILKTDTLL